MADSGNAGGNSGNNKDDDNSTAGGGASPSSSSNSSQSSSNDSARIKANDAENARKNEQTNQQTQAQRAEQERQRTTQQNANTQPRSDTADNVNGTLEDITDQATQIAQAGGLGGVGILDVTGLSNIPIIGTLSNAKDLKDLAKDPAGDGDKGKKADQSVKSGRRREAEKSATNARGRIPAPGAKAAAEKKSGLDLPKKGAVSAAGVGGASPGANAGGAGGNAARAGINALRNGEGVGGAAKQVAQDAAKQAATQAVKKVATQAAVKAGIGAAAGAATGGASIVIQGAVEVIWRWIKKNPWSIPVIVIAALMPIILTISIIGGTVVALGSLSNSNSSGTSQTCGDNASADIDNLFGSGTLDANTTLAKSQLMGECGVATADGSCVGSSVTTASTFNYNITVAGYSGDQLKNAAQIMQAASDLKLPLQAQIVGVMTSMGESSLVNIDYGDNAVNPDGSIADSIGLFQQQSSWGSVADRLNPYKSATFFFQRLKTIKGWEDMAPTLAAHAVQINADPNHYTQYLAAAKAVVAKLGGADVSCDADNATFAYDAKYWKQIYQLALSASSPADYQSVDVTGTITKIRALVTKGTGNDSLLQAAQSDLDGFVKQYSGNQLFVKIAAWAKAKTDHSYNSDIADQIIAAARTRIGVHYIETSNWNVSKQDFCDGTYCGFDCARFVGWSLAQTDYFNVNTKSTSYQPGVLEGNSGATLQYAYLLAHGGAVVSAADASPGDLLFLHYPNSTGYDHVVIYTGMKSGIRQFIEAPMYPEDVIERAAWWSNDGDTLVYVRPY